MGGIVARRYLVANLVNLIDVNTVFGLLLVASPSLGSEVANTLDLMNRLLYGNTQLKALQFSADNTWLTTLDQDFMKLKDSCRLTIIGKELVEQESIPLQKHLLQSAPIVPWFSANRYFDSVRIPYSDHMSICKPTEKAAEQH